MSSKAMEIEHSLFALYIFGIHNHASKHYLKLKEGCDERRHFVSH
nr:hypothetical protein Iba_scaffold14370CG0750 [Ipomoea batatas]